MRRVLILSASYGEGHNAAARSLVTAFDQLHGEGTADLQDPLAETAPRRDRLARSAYYFAINRLPRAWSAFYAWLDRTKPLPRYLGLLERESAWLEQHVRATRPQAVLCTYPIFAFIFQRLAKERGIDVPLYNVVTDSISINSMWWLAPCAGWFLPNEDSAEVVRSVGTLAEKVHVKGFPVPPLFADASQRLEPPNLSRGATPRVLYIINSGASHALETATRLIRETGWELTFAVGRDKNLRKKIAGLAQNRPVPVEVLGWTDRIPELLMTHHAVISKAGGATTQESIAAHCPMIVNQVVPGQEEGNYELLRRRDIGARADSPTEILNALRGAFARNALVWEGWHERVQQLARPRAALDIAEFVAANGSGSNPDTDFPLQPITSNSSPAHG